jgi:hypothetical protein
MLSTRSSTRSARSFRQPFRLLAAGCLSSTALMLAGCGGSSHPAAVASLGGQSRASTRIALSSNQGVPDPDGRPRDTLDATDKQERALWGPYYACLRAHDYVDQSTIPARLAVVAKCKKIEPLPVWQFDPANPQARAFIGSVVACLQRSGFHARAALVTNGPMQPPDWEVRYPSYNIQIKPKTLAAQNACQRQASK